MSGTYELFDGATIEYDDILYIDPTNGDQNNDGLTEDTPKKFIPELSSRTAGTEVIVIVSGDHIIDDDVFFNHNGRYQSSGTYGEDTMKFFLHAHTRNTIAYIVANPLNTSFHVNLATRSKNRGFIGADKAAYGQDTSILKVIGIRATLISDGDVFGFCVYSNRGGYGDTSTIENCYFDYSGVAPYDSSNSIIYINYGLHIKNTIFYGGARRFSIYANSELSIANSALIATPAPTGYLAANNNNIAATPSAYEIDDDYYVIRLSDNSVAENTGVNYGSYSWLLFKVFAAQIRDANGDYYVFDDNDQLIPATSAGDTVPSLLTQGMIDQINNLTDPKLVFIVNDIGDFHAIKTADKQLMIPTGDIDISLAASVLRFDFDDTGDVRRLASVDSGDSWQYYDNGAWATYTGDITDKEALYAVANDSATLNALGEADIALLIPPETLVKRIRFLTILRQETLQSATITRSVSVESMRRGRYESVPAAQFSETVSFGNLAVKYIGTAALAELRLLISVSEGKR